MSRAPVDCAELRQPAHHQTHNAPVLPRVSVCPHPRSSTLSQHAAPPRMHVKKGVRARDAPPCSSPPHPLRVAHQPRLPDSGLSLSARKQAPAARPLLLLLPAAAACCNTTTTPKKGGATPAHLVTACLPSQARAHACIVEPTQATTSAQSHPLQLDTKGRAGHARHTQAINVRAVVSGKSTTATKHDAHHDQRTTTALCASKGGCGRPTAAVVQTRGSAGPPAAAALLVRMRGARTRADDCCRAPRWHRYGTRPVSS
jgi:hypothetical protein